MCQTRLDWHPEGDKMTHCTLKCLQSPNAQSMQMGKYQMRDILIQLVTSTVEFD